MDLNRKKHVLAVGSLAFALALSAGWFAYNLFPDDTDWCVSNRISHTSVVRQPCELRVELIDPQQVRPYTVAAVAVPATAADMALYPTVNFAQVAAAESK